MFKRFAYVLLQIKALFVFGRRVYVHGNFSVGNRRNIMIGELCSINTGVYILGRGKVVIGNRVTLSARSMLLDSGLEIGSKVRAHVDGYITIEDDVWIGAGAIVLSGVTIGRGSIVGAGSVVTKPMPADCVVAGNPARVVRRLGAARASTAGLVVR
jgi:maltose O-acetyltransferase